MFWKILSKLYWFETREATTCVLPSHARWWQERKASSIDLCIRYRFLNFTILQIRSLMIILYEYNKFKICSQETNTMYRTIEPIVSNCLNSSDLPCSLSLDFSFHFQNLTSPLTQIYRVQIWGKVILVVENAWFWFVSFFHAL